MRRMWTLALAIGLATTAQAQDDPDVISAMAGDRIVLPVDGSPGCHVAMSTRKVRGGYAVKPAADCARRVPAMAKAVAWTIGDDFLDAAGKTVMSFEEDERALPTSPTLMAPKYILYDGHPGLTRLPTLANTAGEWAIVRTKGGAQVCTAALLPPATAGADEGVLKLGKGCPARGVPAGLMRWAVEDVSVSFYDKTGDKDLHVDIWSDGQFRDYDDALRLVRPKR